MQDKLKKYIDANRADFDCFEAPDLWAGIQAGIHSSIPIVKPKSFLNMIKYGFGASVVVITTSIALLTVNGKTDNTDTKRVEENLKKNQVEIASASPSSVQKLEEEKTPQMAKEKIVTKFVSPEPDIFVDTTSKENEIIARVQPVLISELSVVTDSVRQTFNKHKVDTLFKNIKKIEVECKFMNVKITGTPGDAVALRGEIHQYACENILIGKSSKRKSAYVIRYKQDKDLLRVWIENSKEEKELPDADDKDGPSYLNLDVPDGMDLDVKNSSGNIGISACKTNVVTLKTQFGNIKLDDVSGKLKLLASSGGISGSSLSGTIDCSSNFGSVHLNNIKGNVSIQSSSGATSIENLVGDAKTVTAFGSQKYHNITGELHTTASSGSIKVSQLKGKLTSSTSFGTQSFENIDGDIKAEANSGNIKIYSSKGKLDLSTTFGSIKGEDIALLGNCQFKASSGNINMDFLNDLKELKFDLRSSAGMISVGEGETKSKSDKILQMGDGAILISGISSFGSQIYH